MVSRCCRSRRKLSSLDSENVPDGTGRVGGDDAGHERSDEPDEQEPVPGIAPPPECDRQSPECDGQSPERDDQPGVKERRADGIGEDRTAGEVLTGPGITRESEEFEIGDHVLPHQRRISCQQPVQGLAHLGDAILGTGVSRQPGHEWCGYDSRDEEEQEKTGPGNGSRGGNEEKGDEEGGDGERKDTGGHVRVEAQTEEEPGKQPKGEWRMENGG